MKSLQSSLSTRLQSLKESPNKRKIDHEFQAIGVEIMDYMKTLTKREKSALWASFYKYPYDKHREALKICKARGIASIRYFFGVLTKLK